MITKIGKPNGRLVGLRMIEFLFFYPLFFAKWVDACSHKKPILF